MRRVEQALENVLPEPQRYFEIVDGDSMQIVREGLSQFKYSADPEFQARN